MPVIQAYNYSLTFGEFADYLPPEDSPKPPKTVTQAFCQLLQEHGLHAAINRLFANCPHQETAEIPDGTISSREQTLQIGNLSLCKTTFNLAYTCQDDPPDPVFMVLGPKGNQLYNSADEHGVVTGGAWLRTLNDLADSHPVCATEAGSISHRVAAQHFKPER